MGVHHGVPCKPGVQNWIAPVPLAPPKPKKSTPGESLEHKLCTAPTDGSPPQCELRALTDSNNKANAEQELKQFETLSIVESDNERCMMMALNDTADLSNQSSSAGSSSSKDSS